MSFTRFSGAAAVYRFTTLDYNLRGKTLRQVKDLKLKIIISGGQTGADRAAFDFALEHGIEISGFVPRGRRAEDGRLADVYPNLTETASRNYAVRTELNVRAADATLIVSRGKLTRGSLTTRKFAERHGKPCRHVDLLAATIEEAARKTREWLVSIDCRSLNVAGPRASTDPEIYGRTKLFLAALFGVE